MADNEHLHSATAVIALGGNTGGPYVALADVRGITPPTFSRAKSKDTTLQSTGRTHQYRFDTWLEPGEVTLDLYFYQGQFVSLTNQFTLTGTNTTYYWKITVPLLTSQGAGGNLVFAAGITSLGMGQYSVDSDERIRMPVTLAITGTAASGLPVWTNGA